MREFQVCCPSILGDEDDPQTVFARSIPEAAELYGEEMRVNDDLSEDGDAAMLLVREVGASCWEHAQVAVHVEVKVQATVFARPSNAGTQGGDE